MTRNATNRLRAPLFALSLAAVSLGFAASPLVAQRAVQVGISAGLGIPTGDLADFQESGYHIGGHINLAPQSLPFELLFDATYHSFSGNSDLLIPIDFSYFSVGANAAFMLSSGGVRPYIMGGVGMYWGKPDIEGAESESEFGFDVGGGIRFQLAGFSSFLQARMNFVDDATFVPISFGVIF